MKNYLSLLLLTLFLAQAGLGQSLDTLPWSPSGAYWVYEYQVLSPNEEHFFILAYEEDTIMEGRTVKKMATRERNFFSYVTSDRQHIFRERYDSLLGYEYMYQEEDTIFRYNAARGTFDYLYVFARSVGVRWEVQPEPSRACDSSLMLADTVEVVNLGRYQTGDFIFETIGVEEGPLWGFGLGGRLIRNIGVSDGPFPQISRTNCNYPQETVCYNPVPPMYLVCYQDDVRGLALGSRYSICSSLLSSVGRTEGIGASNDYKVYPNPVADVLYLGLVDGAVGGLELGAYRISDIMGRTVLLAREAFPSSGLDLGFLVGGVYFLELYVDSRWVVLKFIKR